MNKELHLLIIWEKGRNKEKEILDYISNNFELVEIYKIKWDKKKFSKNLSAFYGSNLPPKSKKELHCGDGEFITVTFFDKQPRYEYVETSRGTEKVNINIFEIKNKFRLLTGGGHKIHTTNTTRETNHDLTLLLGLNCYDYEKIIKNKKNSKKEIISISKNITGVDGWKNLYEFFYVINSTLNYVVLRNFENLPDIPYGEKHPDIDFLVKNLDEAVYIMQAEKVFKENFRVYYKLNVSGDNVYIDLRSVGDEYYDKNWQIEILNTRIFHEKKFYIPSNENYFFTLVYHVLIHKIEISSDYYHKIAEIFKRFISRDEKKLNFTYYFEMLENFLKKNEYEYVRPKDFSVFFETKYTRYKDSVANFFALNIDHIKPFLIDEWKNISQFIYFTGKQIDNKKVFIKCNGIEDSVRREYRILQELRNNNTEFFPKPYYYRLTKDEKFIVTEFVEGKNLSTINIKTQPKNFREKFYKGILAILKILHKTDIVHRDIRPHNFIIKDDGSPILIDFQFAVDTNRKRYKEYKLIKKKPKKIATLGREYLRHRYYWDDAYSLYKIFDEIRNEDDEYLRVKSEIKKLINKKIIVSVKKNYFSKLLVVLKLYLSNFKKNQIKLIL